MQRVRVKIEGLRDAAAARRVAEMGADAIGLVFAESPRRVTVEEARDIVIALPTGVATVGVFVNAEPSDINRVVEETGIQYVQLHGDEPPSIVAQIHAPCIKAFRVKDEGWVNEVMTWLGCAPGANRSRSAKQREPASGEAFLPSRLTVLLDAYDPAVRGGSGRRFNWELIAAARARGEMEGLGPIILAGGLTPECVAEAIRSVGPWAVDVASGVESSPGVKDLRKVRAFLEAVRAVTISDFGPAGRRPGFRIAD